MTGPMLLAQADTTAAAPAVASGATAGTIQPAPEAKEPFPPFNPEWFASQLLWLAITFIALYVLLQRVAIPRIGGILKARADRIAGDIDRAQQAKAQSDAAVAGYEKALATARVNANAIAGKARDEAKTATDAERATTEAELNNKIAASEEGIRAIKQRALAEVNAIASDAATAIVKALTGADVGQGEADAAVSDAMKAGT
jgi:F-type H+-transporting ATPase subunit b